MGRGRALEENTVELSQWFTPPDIARRLWAMACEDVVPRSVLEPSAGLGALLAPVVEAGVARVVAYDVDPLVADDLWLVYGHAVEVVCADFLRADVREHFDLALMNPPYERDLDTAFILKALGYCDRIAGIFKSDLLHGKERHEKLWDAGVRVVRGARAISRWRFGGDQTPSRNYVALILEDASDPQIRSWVGGRVMDQDYAADPRLEMWEWWP